MKAWDSLKKLFDTRKVAKLEAVSPVEPVAGISVSGKVIRRYSVREVGGEVVRWIESTIEPRGTVFVVEKGTDTILTTGVLPLPEVK